MTNQSKDTRAVMTVLSFHRQKWAITYRRMAEFIENEGYRITGDEYRACEQGLTKRVPLDVVIYAARVLGIEPDVLFIESDLPAPFAIGR